MFKHFLLYMIRHINHLNYYSWELTYTYLPYHFNVLCIVYHSMHQNEGVVQ